MLAHIKKYGNTRGGIHTNDGHGGLYSRGEVQLYRWVIGEVSRKLVLYPPPPPAPPPAPPAEEEGDREDEDDAEEDRPTANSKGGARAAAHAHAPGSWEQGAGSCCVVMGAP